MPTEPPSDARAEELRAAVLAKYGEVADEPTGHFPYAVGREGATALGYDAEWLDRIDSDVVDGFVGVGNPLGVRAPRKGERVLDLGCGCGLDCFVAALHVGSEGHAAGVDLSDAMLARPMERADAWPPDNVSFHLGDLEHLPFGDGSFDAVSSNGALNLVPDKPAAFREIHRVLVPGGALVVADLLVVEDVPADVLDDMDAWST